MTRLLKKDSLPQEVSADSMAVHLQDLAAEARRVVLDARKESARIVAEARQQANRISQQAAEEGYAEGFARGQLEGMEQGRQAGREEILRQADNSQSDSRNELRAAIDSLRSARQEVADDAREQMIEFALQLASRIVGRVCVTDTAAAEANLAKALRRAGDGELVVLASSYQSEELSRRCGDWLDPAVRERITLQPSEEMTPGGVKVLCRQGEIDATIETQIDNVVRSLLGRPMREAERADLGQYVAETQQEIANCS